MLWLSDVAGSTTDLRTLQRNNRESVQADVERIRQEIKEGKRHKVGSPAWMKEAGLVYNVKEERVDRLDEINKAVNDAVSNKSLGVDRPARGTDLLKKTFKPMQWIVDGLIAEGMGVIMAPPKVGKSFFVLDLAISVAAGIPVCGDLDTHQRPVLYMALEDGERRLQSRIYDLGKPVPDDFYFFIEMPPEEAVLVADKFIRENPRALVIIDTLAKVMTDKKNGSTQYLHDHKGLSDYQSISKREGNEGSCILFVHHTRKEKSEDWVDSLSGTQGIAGATDFMMSLSGKRGSTTAQLRVTGREVEDHSVTLKRDTNGFWLHDDEALEIHTEQPVEGGSADIVDTLKGWVNGATPADLAEELGWERKKVNTYLGRLVKRGLVRKSAGSRYMVVE